MFNYIMLTKPIIIRNVALWNIYILLIHMHAYTKHMHINHARLDDIWNIDIYLQLLNTLV